MVPRPLALARHHRVVWALLALALALAGCVSGGLMAVGGPGSVALGPLRPVPQHAAAPAPDTPAALAPGVSLVATATGATVPVYPWAGASHPGLQLPSPTTAGAPLSLLVAAVQGSWVETYLPVRPNGMTGWVPKADVTLTQDPYRISVSLLARELRLYDGPTLVTSAPVAVGSPTSPTPIGRFFVTAVLQITDPQNAYGPYAMGLSAFSDTYSSFDGGPGQVAVHGTNEPWVIGGYASHGCVRLANADIARIAPIVPAGTPVEIGP